MTIKKTTISLLLMLASLLCSACLPQFKNSVTPADQANIDKRLLGVWQFKDRLSTTYLHISYAEPTSTPSNWLMATLVEHRSNGTSDVQRYRFITSQIGKRRFVNALNENADPAEDYLLIHYTLNNDQLEIGLINDSLVNKAIKDGVLVGEKKKEQFTTRTVITAGTNDLVGFINKYKTSDLFDTRVVFKRH